MFPRLPLGASFSEMSSSTARSASDYLAVLSDIHGNLVALRAVLAELDAQGVGEIVVAGDMVGFGPNPGEVVDLLVERGARLIRGNHEKDYVAPYLTPRMPPTWRTDPRLRSMIWSLDQIGRDRRAFLAALPDALRLDPATLVVHGSPRHVRDSVLASTPDAELDLMFASDPARLAFMGHTHRPLVRRTARRTLVNAGSVGLPLDRDPRAGYVLVGKPEDPSAERTIEIRRVPYDVDAAIAAFDNGLRDVDSGYAEIMTRQLRAARDYLGPWLRLSHGLPAEDLPDVLRKYLSQLDGPNR